MITKAKKAEILSDLGELAKKAKTIVFVNFHGLSAGETANLRKKLTSEKVGYRVAKKTLIRKALGAEKYAGEMPELPGEVALAYSEDLLAPAREIYNFHKTHKENVQIVGGVFEGKYLDQAAMLAIATIPPAEVLYGQLVGLLSSPYRRFVVALDQIAKKKA